MELRIGVVSGLAPDIVVLDRVGVHLSCNLLNMNRKVLLRRPVVLEIVFRPSTGDKLWSSGYLEIISCQWNGIDEWKCPTRHFLAHTDFGIRHLGNDATYALGEYRIMNLLMGTWLVNCSKPSAAPTEMPVGGQTRLDPKKHTFVCSSFVGFKSRV